MSMNDIYENILQWIERHREEYIEDVKRMVRHPSVSMPGKDGYAFGIDCKKCADDFLSLGESYGFSVENDDYYCASIVLKGETGCDKEIGILGHLDVVPEGDGWDFPPYEPRYIDGYITGRGSGDNKGPVIMSLYAMRCIKELGIKLNNDIRLIAGFNEEAGMKDVEHYVKSHSRLPDVTIICDGGWACCVGEKGRLTAELVQHVKNGNLLMISGGVAPNAVPDSAWAELLDIDETQIVKLKSKYNDFDFDFENGVLRISSHGKATHAFHPDEGDNAIYKLINLLVSENLVTEDALKALKNLSKAFIDNDGTGLCLQGYDPVFGKTTCVGGVVGLSNGILSQSVDCRFSMNPDAEVLRNRFISRCNELDFEIKDFDMSPGYLKDKNEPVLKLLLDVFDKYFDRKCDTYVMGGGTHARKIPNAYGFGPAEMDRIAPFSGQAHGKNETCCVDRLLVSLRVYVMALIELDRYLSEKKGE